MADSCHTPCKGRKASCTHPRCAASWLVPADDASCRWREPRKATGACEAVFLSGYCARGWIGQNVCSARLLRPWKPKTCSFRSEDRLHPCPLSCECSAPTLRQRKQNHERVAAASSLNEDACRMRGVRVHVTADDDAEGCHSVTYHPGTLLPSPASPTPMHHCGPLTPRGAPLLSPRAEL